MSHTTSNTALAPTVSRRVKQSLDMCDQFFDSGFPLTRVGSTWIWQGTSPEAIAELLLRSEWETDIDLALDLYEEAYLQVTDANRKEVAIALLAKGSNIDVLSHGL